MYLKKQREKANNFLIGINIKKKKIVDRFKFKIRTGYYLKLFTMETMKLLGSTKNK